MGIRWLTTKAQPLTKKLANEFADMAACASDVGLSQLHIDTLAKRVVEGTFHSPRWSALKCLEDGVTYRVDGKHSSTMFARGVAPLIDTDVFVQRGECDTLSDVATGFLQFDSPESTRTSSEQNMAVASAIDELKGIIKRTINLCVSGIDMGLRKVVNAGGKDARTPRSDQAMRQHDYVPYILFVDSIFSFEAPRKYAQHLERVPATAAMFLSFQDSPMQARAFWTHVRDADTSPGTAARELAEFLKATSPRTRGKRPNVANERQQMAECMKRWEEYKASATEASIKPVFKKRGRRPVAA